MTILTLPLRGAFGAARIGFGVAERLLEAVLPSPPEPEAAPAEPARPAAAPSQPVSRRETPAAAQPRIQPQRRSDPAPVEEPPEPEPEHVSEEPVLVAEVADPGAEDGPGAAITVDEPWEGYRRMKAAEILARIDEASREELAVVELYETINRRRTTVLAAAERRLKVLSPPGRG